MYTIYNDKNNQFKLQHWIILHRFLHITSTIIKFVHVHCSCYVNFIATENIQKWIQNNFGKSFFNKRWIFERNKNVNFEISLD